MTEPKFRPEDSAKGCEERAQKEIVFMRSLVEKKQELGLTQDELTRCLDWFCDRFNVPMGRS